MNMSFIGRNVDEHDAAAEQAAVDDNTNAIRSIRRELSVISTNMVREAQLAQHSLDAIRLGTGTGKQELLLGHAAPAQDRDASPPPHTHMQGHATDLETYMATISPRILTPGFIAATRQAGKLSIDAIINKVTTHTSNKLFDRYIGQDYLDNVLRGGIPLQLTTPNPAFAVSGGGSGSGSTTDGGVAVSGLGPNMSKTYHAYSRIHGDIERDYNDFLIETTYYSQGPGNFRDVCQNRRMDVFLDPTVGTFNILNFLSFIQGVFQMLLSVKYR